MKYFFILILCTTVIELLILALVVFFVVETASFTEKKAKLKSPLKTIAASYSLIFKDRLFLKFAVASLMTMGLEKQITKFISVHLGAHFHPFSFLGQTIQGVEMFGILRVENSAVVVFLAFAVVALLAKLKVARPIQLYAGLALFTCGYAVLAFSIHFWVLLVFMFLLSIGESMFIPVKKVLLADIARDESRSQYMAANSLSMSAGNLLSSVLLSFGSLLHAGGMAVVNLLIGATAILMFAVIFQERRRLKIAEKESVSVS